MDISILAARNELDHKQAWLLDDENVSIGTRMRQMNIPWRALTIPNAIVLAICRANL